MKCVAVARALGIGSVVLTLSQAAAPPPQSAEAALTTLTTQVLGGLVKHNSFFLNQFGIPSYTVAATRRTSEGDTVATVEFSSGGKTAREELVYRIVEAELYLTEEKATLGISGLARIEWTWGLRKEGLRAMGESEAFYFVLSKKTGAWVSVIEKWAPAAFRDVKSDWVARHAIVRGPRR